MVRDQTVVILDDVIFSDYPPFRGTFLFLGPFSRIYKDLDSGRKVVCVACHWEGSDDGDDYMNLMVADPWIRVVDLYSGPVVSRIESTGPIERVTWAVGWCEWISSFISKNLRGLCDR
jgi:hypothetical protein